MIPAYVRHWEAGLVVPNTRAKLVKDDGAVLMFAHALIQEATYASLLSETARRLHRRAADWLGYPVAIKIDSPGPVFYRRRVVGVGGKLFDAFKFRTMCVDADDRLQAQEVTAP